MEVDRAAKNARQAERERSERVSFRIALAIALLPIPLAILIAWALGDPPWRARPHRPAHPPEIEAPAEPGHR